MSDDSIEIKLHSWANVIAHGPVVRFPAEEEMPEEPTHLEKFDAQAKEFRDTVIEKIHAEYADSEAKKNKLLGAVDFKTIKKDTTSKKYVIEPCVKLEDAPTYEDIAAKKEDPK